MAVPSLLRHCVDVSRGLCPRRNKDAARDRAGRRIDRQTHCGLFDSAVTDKPSPAPPRHDGIYLRGRRNCRGLSIALRWIATWAGANLRSGALYATGVCFLLACVAHGHGHRPAHFLIVEYVGVRTVRESDGFAMSSRYRRLKLRERAFAPCHFKALLASNGRIERRERNVVAIKDHA